MRVLVTGAGGFIGSHLVEALRDAGQDVRAMARYTNRDSYGWLDEIEGVERVRGDVTTYAHIERLIRGVDRVYNLAAYGSVPYSFENPHAFVETNTIGTLNVALACIEHGADLVQTSTSEVYGNSLPPQDENTPLRPLSPYAASKIGADALVRSLCAARGLNAVILRPFNTYGPRQSARAIIPRIVLSCLEGRKVELGNLRPKRDLLYVADTVSAFMTVQPSSACEMFVAATGTSISMDGLAQKIRTMCGRPDIEVVSSGGRPDDAEVWCLLGLSTRLSQLGWQPKVSLDEGLARTVAWFANRGARLLEGMV